MNMCVIPVMTGVFVALCDGSIIVRVCVCGGYVSSTPWCVLVCVWGCVCMSVCLSLYIIAGSRSHGLFLDLAKRLQYGEIGKAVDGNRGGPKTCRKPKGEI